MIEKDVDYVYIPMERALGSQEFLSQLVGSAIFQFLNATLSETCMEVVRALLCNYYFIPCGRNGTTFPPQAICRDECEYFSIDLCPDKWQTISNFFETDPFFESVGVSLVNCSNPGEILEPLPHCCTNLGIIPGKNVAVTMMWYATNGPRLVPDHNPIAVVVHSTAL